MESLFQRRQPDPERGIVIMSLDTDFKHWLNQATRGLPTQVNTVVRCELEAHYEDALSEHQALGKSLHDAHLSALVELGDVKAVAQALHDVHLAHRRYWKAAFASIAPSIAFLLIVFSQAGHTIPLDLFNYTGLLGFLTFFAVFYVLRSFKVLLAGSHQIGRPTSIVMWSLLCVTILSVISQWLFNNHVALVVNDPMIVTDQLFSETSLPLEWLLNCANVISVLVLGVGWIYLSDRLIGVDDDLYGLVKPLRYLLLLNGVVIASSGLATLLGLFNANVISVIALVIVGTSKYAVWTLLFFRAAYQDSKRPIQMA
jgi:hypothetical protein